MSVHIAITTQAGHRPGKQLPHSAWQLGTLFHHPATGGGGWLVAEASARRPSGVQSIKACDPARSDSRGTAGGRLMGGQRDAVHRGERGTDGVCVRLGAAAATAEPTV